MIASFTGFGNRKSRSSGARGYPTPHAMVIPHAIFSLCIVHFGNRAFLYVVFLSPSAGEVKAA
jgi:hypothetical protein